jgi:hypothetical protein
MEISNIETSCGRKYKACVFRMKKNNNKIQNNIINVRRGLSQHKLATGGK